MPAAPPRLRVVLLYFVVGFCSACMWRVGWVAGKENRSLLGATQIVWLEVRLRYAVSAEDYLEAERVQRRLSELTGENLSAAVGDAPQDVPPAQQEASAATGHTEPPTAPPPPAPPPAPAGAVPAGTQWQLVFRQTAPGTFARGELRKNPGDPNADNFAVLDDLGRLRREDGSLLFRMVFPRRPAGSNTNIWLQTSSPTDSRGPTQGYRPISIQLDRDDVSDRVFGGLRASVNPRCCLMHNSDRRAPRRFWYAIGARSPDGWPGAQGNLHEKQVELYVGRPRPEAATGDGP
eukprot:TRINITY_DN31320_c0_g1_i2.p3 TRINITY_DN31320_c0_g1~~TRINITY_DN31320_c0_g1_i2.p3  ORF type:complete len:321 (+),score=85.49 TRINITY_DN31320_c0_g1_i2:91-963(+)